MVRVIPVQHALCAVSSAGGTTEWFTNRCRLFFVRTGGRYGRVDIDGHPAAGRVREVRGRRSRGHRAGSRARRSIGRVCGHEVSVRLDRNAMVPLEPAPRARL